MESCTVLYTNDCKNFFLPASSREGQGVRLTKPNEMTMRSLTTLFLIIFVSTGSVNAQPYATAGEYETALQQQFDQTSRPCHDSVKHKIYRTIEDLFAGASLLPEAFEYPFDSLKKVGKIRSNDGKLRVFTWDLVYNNGSHKYFGTLLYRKKNTENPLVIRLVHHSGNVTEPELMELNPDNWFGALYYEIVEKKRDGNTLYTLLGYDPNNIFTSRKIIDCLYLREDSIPVFGAPVFKMKNTTQYRVIFEYSARVSMSLRYHESMKMIVFDHLSPARPSYQGNYRFYGPDFSFDAFKFTDNRWELVENIDARNME